MNGLKVAPQNSGNPGSGAAVGFIRCGLDTFGQNDRVARYTTLSCASRMVTCMKSARPLHPWSVLPGSLLEWVPVSSVQICRSSIGAPMAGRWSSSRKVGPTGVTRNPGFTNVRRRSGRITVRCELAANTRSDGGPVAAPAGAEANPDPSSEMATSGGAERRIIRPRCISTPQRRRPEPGGTTSPAPPAPIVPGSDPLRQTEGRVRTGDG
jgi:hypothetical protein